MKTRFEGRQPIDFYTIQLSQLADGSLFVEMTATMMDEAEQQLISQQVLSEQVQQGQLGSQCLSSPPSRPLA